MAVLEELIKSVELWLKLVKKQQPLINPNLDPVLLVPGIAGSILNAVDENGNEERVWVRILGADHEFQKKMWSRFDPSTEFRSTVSKHNSLSVLGHLSQGPSPAAWHPFFFGRGKTVSLDEKTKIVVPEDRYGLYAIDVLDPDMIVGRDGVCYYHDMIEEMIKWGYQEGKTLFGFGYDFRQSNRLQETLDKFSEKLESIYTSSGEKKLNIITHSMGGLLVKCFMCLHSDIFEKYVNSWIAIAAPFQGAPGYITSSLLNGMSFVEGWEGNFFISKWSMQQLLIECPSIYELMACPDFSWDIVPLLQLWAEKQDGFGEFNTMLESYEPSEAVILLNKALSGNMVTYDGMQLSLPFNLEILKWAKETRKILSNAKLPTSVKFYNIYGINEATAHTVCYGSEEAPISDLQQLLCAQIKYICVNGDGTVPAESAKADGLDAVARVGVPADHRGIVCDRHVFRILRHWLKAGEPDPFYNPVNDYVILPTAFEIEQHHEESMQVTSLKEEWEIISSTNDGSHSKSVDLPAMMGSLSVSCEGKEQPLEGAQATVVVHPQHEGRQHVEIRAVGITMGA